MFTFVFEHETNHSKSVAVSKKTNCSNNPKGKKIPRPPNGFMLYCKAHRNKKDLSHLHESEKCRIFGKMWESESEKVQTMYRRWADEEKLKHSQIYPDYKYAPKQKRKAVVLTTETEKQNSISKKTKAADIEHRISPALISKSASHNLQTDGILDSRANSEDKEYADKTERTDNPAVHVEVNEPLSLPSDIVDAQYMFPGGSNMDILALVNFEMYTLLHVP
jgi:hypothetical protein